MSDTAILTLRTMLANLDDAKKYQSLRDVMSTLPAPDLAAVFEDLPPEKLPVLFRLCPKDLAAEIFAELTPETQQGLIDGLTDKEFKSAKARLRGGFLLGLESSGGRMQALGRGHLLMGHVRTPEETLSRIEAVTPDAVMELARRLLGQKGSAAIVGRGAEALLARIGG